MRIDLRFLLLFLMLLMIFPAVSRAQSASFTAPDTVCVNTPVTIKNLSAGITSSFWNFCVSSINGTPAATNLGNIGGLLRAPVFVDNVFQNGNYYGFLVNNDPGKLIRLDFGNSLLNTPSATDLGDFGGIIPRTAEGIQVIEENGRWQAIIVGGTPLSGGTPRIMKIDFGANLNNPNPIATNWGNIGNMDQSIDLYLFKDKTTWYGFTTNSSNNSITRFNFGTDFSNPPTAVNLGSFGSLSYPTGIYTISDNGFWRIFVTNGTSNTITRLDFGSSLLNNPVAVNLGLLSNTLRQPRDIYIMKLCDETVGFVVNGITSDLVKLDFAEGLDKVPKATSLGNVGSLSFPHSISQLFRVGSDIFSLVPNVNNNTLTRLEFRGCVDISILNSSAFDPPTVTYTKAGTYNINLMVDEGLPTQSSVCKTIVVIEPPKKNATINTAFCEGDSLLLETTFLKGNITWNDGSTKNSILVKNPGIYWVTSDAYGCTARDSIIVSQNNRPIVKIGKDTSICTYDSLILDAGAGFANYLWHDGSTQQTMIANKAQMYSVMVTGSNKCTNKDSINLVVNPLADIQLTKDTTICVGSTIQLSANGPGISSYKWLPDLTLSNSAIFNPVANPINSTKYFISVIDQNGCKNEDSVLVDVAALPVVNTIPDSALCSGSSLFLTTAGDSDSKYQWSPAIYLSNPAVQSPVASPLSDTEYTVTATNSWNCTSQASVQIKIKSLPVLKAFGDTTICSATNVQLSAVSSGIRQVSWYPNIYLDNNTISNPIASPVQTTTYVVTVTGNNQCHAKDSVKVQVFPKPSFAINPTIIEICKGDQVTLAASGGDQYQWIPASTVSGTSGSSAIFSPTVNTDYQVVITDNNCLVSETLTAKVSLKPKAELSITKSNDINCILGETTLSASGGVSYQWKPAVNLSDPTLSITKASPQATTMYYLEAVAMNGCLTKDSIQVLVKKVDTDQAYQLPNAFTPNNDGINDCFGISKWGTVTDLKFSIFNRFGERVFYTTNPFNCWNGKFKGTAQDPGSFVYVIQGKGNCGLFERKGSVLLIR